MFICSWLRAPQIVEQSIISTGKINDAEQKLLGEHINVIYKEWNNTVEVNQDILLYRLVFWIFEH